jgi:hypothetical protein
LLETISLFYNIPILGENDKKLFNTNIAEVRISNTVLRNFRKLLYINSYKRVLSQNEKIKDGVIRFHPLQLLEKPDFEIKLDFKFFNFKQYNKIYLTFRDPIDAIASEFVAETVKRWTYKSKEDLLKIDPIFLSEHSVIKEYIHSEHLVKKIKEYFNANDIKSTDLFYDEIPQYLIDNFPGAKTFHIETNYDYRKIVTNYDDILPLYNHYNSII